ncbi:MAG: hypothetical protein ACLP2P_10305 [Desulfobaccales bacterium]
MATQLTVGARIYRPARLVEADGGYGLELYTPSMKDFGDGTFMLRAAPIEAYLPDWLVAPWETTGGRVCVCDEPIPDDWTYFEVIFEDVNFVAVSPVAGDPEELRRVHLEAARRGREIEATGKRSAPLG